MLYEVALFASLTSMFLFMFLCIYLCSKQSKLKDLHQIKIDQHKENMIFRNGIFTKLWTIEYALKNNSKPSDFPDKIANERN